MKDTVDLLVIGSGPGGYTSAIRGSQKGLKVVLVEEDKIGGTCLNRGCIPTKSLLTDGLFYELNGRNNQSRSEKIFERKSQLVEKLVNGIENQLKMRGILIIRGKATLKDNKTVEVTLDNGKIEEISGRAIVIATGAKAEPDSILKWDGERIITTDDAINLKTVPSSLAIIGGGRRSIEFATFFKSLGVDVTLVESREQILAGFDRELVVRFRRLLTEKKINLRTNCTVTAVNLIDKTGLISLSLETKRGPEHVAVERILMPGRRRGCVDGMGFERVGISLVDGFIQATPNLETSIGGVFAVGDVIGGKLFAHKAIFEGMCVVDNLMGGNRKVRYDLIPTCLWGEPELASIGLTQQEAEDAGREIEVGKFAFMASGRAQTLGQIEGIVKIIAGKKFGEILGVHIIGPQATELIALAGLAMSNELGIEEIKNTMFAHPSLSESFFEAALDVNGEAIHMLKG
jgi:dihydrolipoamide dehydrogenase